MINWTSLLTNTLWLLALSAALAVAGMASWQAAQEETRFLSVVRRRRYSLALQACLAVFCLGVGLSVQSTWERLAWAVLTVLSIIQFVLTLRTTEPNPPERK